MSPIGSFTDPEYAQVGPTETKARKTHDVVVAKVSFDSMTRTIIDGRTSGLLQTDRGPSRLEKSWAATSLASARWRSPRWRR